MSEPKLSERKRKVLQALVDSYIADAEPISSGVIQSKYLSDVSPATIRSELATLEDMGYLVQPHVSSGRVPSTKAYRYYVDNFIGEEDIDADALKAEVKEKFDSVEEIVRAGAKVVSDVTNYTSLLMVTAAEELFIKDVRIIDMFNGNALVLIITDGGVVKNKEIKLPVGAQSNYIETAGALMNKAFAGKRLTQICNDASLIEEELKDFREVFDEVIKLIFDFKRPSDEIYVEGAEKIFDYPEYRDVDNVKNFMQIISHKERVRELMNSDADIRLNVRIGSEECEQLDNMALVSATYSINGREVGHLGVIGPERMDYKKVMNVLKQMGILLGEFENKDGKE